MNWNCLILKCLGFEHFSSVCIMPPSFDLCMFSVCGDLLILRDIIDGGVAFQGRYFVETHSSNFRVQLLNISLVTQS